MNSRIAPSGEQQGTSPDNLVPLCHRHDWSVHEGGWKVVRAKVGLPRFGGHERGSAYNVAELLDAELCGWVGPADCRREGAERSRFRWHCPLPIDWPMVTGEGHVVALENGSG